MSEKLSVNFSYSFEGMIWNMIMDEGGNYLILELRDSETHQVSFTAIDLNGKEILWDGLSFDESWWLGMTALEDDILIFHSYDSNMDPEPKGLIAFDIHKKEVCWQEEGFTYLTIVDGVVIGKTQGEGDGPFKSIQLKDGTQEIVADEIIDSLLTEAGKKNKHRTAFSITYPLHYKEGTAYFDTCRQYIHNRFRREAVTAMDYIEYKGFIVISYYCREDEKLVNFLLITDLDGRLKFHEIIQGNINAVGMETFFIVKNQLIFVKEKNEINSFAL